MGGFNETSSAVSLKNTGLRKYSGTSGQWANIMLAPGNAEIATKVLALTKQTWIDNQNAAMGSRWFLTPKIFNFDAPDVAPTREEGNTGMTAFVMDGKPIATMMFQEMHIKDVNDIFSLNNGSFYGFPITDKSFIIGYTPDNVKVRPIKFDYTRVLARNFNTKDVNARVKFEVKISDVRQLNDFCVELDCINDPDAPAPWYPDLELPITQPNSIKPTLTSVTATAFAFKLMGYDGVPYSAAVKEDIYLRKTTENGTLIPITSIVETTTKGSYTGVIGTQTSGTFYFGLLPAETATTKGVETDIVASFAATIA
jgi:hypothetical protein